MADTLLAVKYTGMQTATMKKKADEFMTSRVFAEEMGINYRTALIWLRDGLVPGAEEEETPIGKYWKIPRTALQMERPVKPGPKKGSKRKVVPNGDVSTATDALDAGMHSAVAGKKAAKKSQKKPARK